MHICRLRWSILLLLCFTLSSDQSISFQARNFMFTERLSSTLDVNDTNINNVNAMGKSGKTCGGMQYNQFSYLEKCDIDHYVYMLRNISSCTYIIIYNISS